MISASCACSHHFLTVTINFLQMGALSKLAHSLGQPILTATCYETIHTWNPDCNGAFFVSFFIIFNCKIIRIWKKKAFLKLCFEKREKK